VLEKGVSIPSLVRQNEVIETVEFVNHRNMLELRISVADSSDDHLIELKRD
jgi:hypothetical protein